MAGNVAGARKAAATNKARHGEDFYRRIGSLGGLKTGVKGFATNPELARIAGAKGGRVSSRQGIKNGQGKRAVERAAKRAVAIDSEPITRRGLIHKLAGLFRA